MSGPVLRTAAADPATPAAGEICFLCQFKLDPAGPLTIYPCRHIVCTPCFHAAKALADKDGQRFDVDVCGVCRGLTYSKTRLGATKIVHQPAKLAPTTPADRRTTRSNAKQQRLDARNKSSPALGQFSGSKPPAIVLDSLGSGGCTAAALVALGVFSTVAEASCSLDSFIGPVHEEVCKLSPKLKACRESAGTPGMAWSVDVVKRAVTSQGYHFKKVRLANLSAAIDAGHKLLLDGILNSAYCLPSSRKRRHLFTRAELQDSDPARDSGSWRHSIAIVAGKIVDDAHLSAPLGMPPCPGRISAGCLHLRDGRACKDRGYLREVCKAYRIFVCQSQECGCRGNCDRAI